MCFTSILYVRMCTYFRSTYIMSLCCNMYQILIDCHVELCIASFEHADGLMDGVTEKEIVQFADQ